MISQIQWKVISMMVANKLWVFRGVFLSSAILLLVGCGSGEPAGKVSGKVNLDGTAVTGGEVTFISTSGASSTGSIGADGSFNLEGGLPAGKYTVCVSPPKITEAPGAEGGKAKSNATKVPAGYFEESTSDLTQEIKDGTNNVTIELKSTGPAKSAVGPKAAP